MKKETMNLVCFFITQTKSQYNDIKKYMYKRLVGLIAHTALTVDLIGVVSICIDMVICSVLLIVYR